MSRFSPFPSFGFPGDRYFRGEGTESERVTAGMVEEAEDTGEAGTGDLFFLVVTLAAGEPVAEETATEEEISETGTLAAAASTAAETAAASAAAETTAAETTTAEVIPSLDGPEVVHGAVEVGTRSVSGTVTTEEVEEASGTGIGAAHETGTDQDTVVTAPTEATVHTGVDTDTPDNPGVLTQGKKPGGTLAPPAPEAVTGVMPGVRGKAPPAPQPQGKGPVMPCPPQGNPPTLYGIQGQPCQSPQGVADAVVTGAEGETPDPDKGTICNSSPTRGGTDCRDDTHTETETGGGSDLEGREAGEEGPSTSEEGKEEEGEELSSWLSRSAFLAAALLLWARRARRVLSTLSQQAFDCGVRSAHITQRRDSSHSMPLHLEQVG